MWGPRPFSFRNRKMLKKVLSASLVLLQILTQTASAMEFRPIAVQPIPALPSLITSDNLKNKNLSSNVNDFLFFKLSECFKLGLCRNETSAKDGTEVLRLSVGELSNPDGLDNFGAYLHYPSPIVAAGQQFGNPSSVSMVLPEIKSRFQVKPDFSSGFMTSAFFGMRYADVMIGRRTSVVNTGTGFAAQGQVEF